MRFLWVDAGNDPNFTKGDKHAVTGYFLPLWDPRCTPEKLVEIRNRGKVAGVYVGSGANKWPQTEGRAPKQVARIVADEYLRLQKEMNRIKAGSGTDLRVQHNDEQHNAGAIEQLLLETRRLLPKAGLSWTMEGRQASWLSDPASPGTLIAAIVKTKTRCVPQMYNGAMTTVYPLKPEIDKWVAYGVPAKQVTPMWDAAKITAEQGYLFTQGRLP